MPAAETIPSISDLSEVITPHVRSFYEEVVPAERKIELTRKKEAEAIISEVVEEIVILVRAICTEAIEFCETETVPEATVQGVCEDKTVKEKFQDRYVSEIHTAISQLLEIPLKKFSAVGNKVREIADGEGDARKAISEEITKNDLLLEKEEALVKAFIQHLSLISNAVGSEIGLNHSFFSNMVMSIPSPDYQYAKSVVTNAAT